MVYGTRGSSRLSGTVFIHMESPHKFCLLFALHRKKSPRTASFFLPSYFSFPHPRMCVSYCLLSKPWPLGRKQTESCLNRRRCLDKLTLSSPRGNMVPLKVMGVCPLRPPWMDPPTPSGPQEFSPLHGMTTPMEQRAVLWVSRSPCYQQYFLTIYFLSQKKKAPFCGGELCGS